MWYRCLYASTGTDLRRPLRSGATPDELHSTIAGTWAHRRDQGAVDRRERRERGALLTVSALRHDPHLEMHTRGG
jgi:cyclic pyranopterin phosphate synthase